jgi:hypothetical protein
MQRCISSFPSQPGTQMARLSSDWRIASSRHGNRRNRRSNAAWRARGDSAASCSLP